MLNGQWSIRPDSEIYYSVTTSKETVNFVVNAVEGNWNINTADSSQMAAEAVVDLNALDSGWLHSTILA